jgi:hypothetical protein
VRTKPLCLEHRHGGAHPEGACNIAGRRNHAAFAAADDERLVGEEGVVALLNRGVEGVAIDMGNGERVEFVVAENAR